MVRPAFLVGVSATLKKLQLLPDSFSVEVEKTICVISTEHHWFCKREFEPPWLQQRSVQRLWGWTWSHAVASGATGPVSQQTGSPEGQGVLVMVPVPWDSWVGWQLCLNMRYIPEWSAPFLVPVNSALKASLASSSSMVRLSVELPGELWSRALSHNLLWSSELLVSCWMGIVKAALCGCLSKDRLKSYPLFFQLRIFISASGTSK